jgi:hypothetical protein
MKTCLACLLLLLAACGADGDDDPADPVDGLAAPPDGEGVQLRSSLHLEPGTEAYDCRYLALPDQPIEIARFEHAYTPGAHHMLLYPTRFRPDEVELDRSFDCTAGGDLGQTGILYGGSRPEGALPYPDGVAVKQPAGAVVLLESHYLNASEAPLDADVRVNLWYAAAPTTVEAGTLFLRDWAIYLPPAPSEGSAAMSCEIPSPISLYYAVSHMHRRGMAFSSRLVRADEPSRPLYSSTSWADPLPQPYQPLFELEAGDRIEFDCTYRNDLSSPVGEGRSADKDEMCVFIAGYWPRLPVESELCLTAGSGPILEGAKSCEETVSCMLDAGVGDRIGGQACIADTCAGSAGSLSSFLVCVEANDCWGSESCVDAHCRAEWSACSAASCE